MGNHSGGNSDKQLTKQQSDGKSGTKHGSGKEKRTPTRSGPA
jgi:hypothetical protein